jgi:hypothetical protein
MGNVSRAGAYTQGRGTAHAQKKAHRNRRREPASKAQYTAQLVAAVHAKKLGTLHDGASRRPSGRRPDLFGTAWYNLHKAGALAAYVKGIASILDIGATSARKPSRRVSARMSLPAVEALDAERLRGDFFEAFAAYAELVARSSPTRPEVGAREGGSGF